MKPFNFNDYVNNPGAKLVIEHYDHNKPMIWPVLEVQIVMNERLAIRVPQTGYEIVNPVLVDDSGEIRDVDGNLVGTLVFGKTKITMDEFAALVSTLKNGEQFDFTCDEVKGTNWGVAKINMFDSEMIIMATYGGGDSYLLDVSGNQENSELRRFINDVLLDDFVNFIYVEPLKKNDIKL